LAEGHPAGVTNVITVSASHSMSVTTHLHLPVVLRSYPPPWEQGTGLPAGVYVRTLAVCPSDPDIVYVGFGTEGHGVYKSRNAGKRWEQTGLRDAEVFDIAIGPDTCDTLYAAAWEDRVMKSEDGGSKWTSASADLRDVYVYSVAIDPQDRNVVCAGTADQGVYRSVNAAASWSAWGVSNLAVFDLAFAPDEGALYAASWGDGVYKRPRTGATWGAWQRMSNGIPSQHWRIWAVTVHDVDASTVFAATYTGGVYRTLNGAASWTSVLSSPERAYDVAVDPASSDIVYAGTRGGGVYRSTSNGDPGSWRPFNLGLGNLMGRALAIGPDTAEYIHVGTADGAWRRPR
jgi:hypothetical protein